LIVGDLVVGRVLRIIGAGLAVAAVLGLLSCSPPPPVRLGFVGGLSGRVADLGVEARNGATLAVEMRNKTGGVNGRHIELLAEDDRQDPEVAAAVVGKLIDLKVDAIVGPTTSAMAMAALPLVNAAGVVMIAPTVSTRQLSGIDDHFFRVVASTDANAHANADYHYQRLGLRRVSAAYDLNNQSYTQSWLDEYQAEFVRQGGEVVDRVGFASSASVRFPELAQALLASKPDTVLIVANSVDAAMLCQHLRRLDPAVAIATSEWAATEQLIELGGNAVEGLFVAQLFDRHSTLPASLEFNRNYLARFGKASGYGGLTAFDATNVALDAIAAQKRGQTLKQALLARKTFAGVQGPLTFDDYGDTRRMTYLTTIRNGQFVRLP
jgi:branched-chain amino acid transport system substrate-binding protein